MLWTWVVSNIHSVVYPHASFKWLKGCSWLFQGAMMALNGSFDKPWHCLSLIRHPILSWQLARKLSAPQKWGILQIPWRAIPGPQDGSEWFNLLTMMLSCHSSHNWQLPSCAQNFYPRYMRDPPYIFKDAVNGLFQGAATTFNGWIDTPWLCIVLRWLSFHSWQLPILAKPVFPFRHL